MIGGYRKCGDQEWCSGGENIFSGVAGKQTQGRANLEAKGL